MNTTAERNRDLSNLTALECMVHDLMTTTPVGHCRAIGGILVTRASDNRAEFVSGCTSVGLPLKDAAQLLCCSVEFERTRLGMPGDLRADKLETAFQLVQPATHWKDPIDARVGTDTMSVANLRLVDIVESIEFHTATLPRVSVLGFDPKGKGLIYSFKADGYRRGPAGDH